MRDFHLEGDRLVKTEIDGHSSKGRKNQKGQAKPLLGLLVFFLSLHPIVNRDRRFLFRNISVLGVMKLLGSPPNWGAK